MPDHVIIETDALLDVVAGELVRDRRILVEDGRITAVVASGEPLPEGARQIDLRGLTVVPGMIDVHTHLIGEMEFSGIPATQTSPAEEAFLGARNARLTLDAGFTTVRDVGTFRAFVDVALRDAIDRGYVPGPRMQAAGAYLTGPGGAGDVTGLARDIVLPHDLRLGVVRTPTEMRQKVREVAAGGAGVIKILVTGAVLTRGTRPGVVELDEAMVRAAVEEAMAHGLFVAAHAHGTEGIKVAARAGVRSVEHGSLIDDEGIALLRDTGTFLVADLYDGDWIREIGARERWPAETMRKNEETTEAQREGFRNAVAAGIRLAYGTDSGVYPHGDNARQLAYYVRYGMSPLQAIRSATVDAAELMGWADRVGSIQAGRAADLVAVAGNPLDDVDVLRDVRVVVKDGRFVTDRRQPAEGPTGA